MFLYIATAPVYASLSIFKLGLTTEPYGRHSTYQTGCPPGLTPSHDIEYAAIWKINAESKDDLENCEVMLHNQFLKYRMMRRIPGDTEWFDFKGQDGLALVKSFMEKMPWVIREVPHSEIAPPKRPQRQLQKQHCKNTSFVRSVEKKNQLLNNIQKPVIDAIQSFIYSENQGAGYILAPCGSGKTLMTVRGMKGSTKVIICCPSNQIQRQWEATLLGESTFTKKQILTIGTNGTTDKEIIQKFMLQETYCILTTYMSSYILNDLLKEGVLIVLDEAHHLTGVVAKEDEGTGITRRLMMKATELNLKRLSLTFTPRFIQNKEDIDDVYLTMDDEAIFGSKIAELKIRDLIRRGVLPDYRLWTLRDESKKGMGVIGKAECILEAWNAMEVIHGVEQYTLHHLIVFASTNEEAKQITDYFISKTTDTLVLCVKGGDPLKSTIEIFKNAPRAILVNCKVLGEGVDIPVANAVAVTYPKKSQSEITQMILRAGRWYEGKPLFHILLPIMDDEDMSGFEEVLTSLASCDDYVRDEIVLRAAAGKKPTETEPQFEKDGGVIPECIMIEDYDGTNMDEIKKCFTNVRKNLYSYKNTKTIQGLCIKHAIDTSNEYHNTLRTLYPDLPENPALPKNQTWYTYLHPTAVTRITPQDFVKTVLEKNNIRSADAYTQWLVAQPEATQNQTPIVQYINDGFFGADCSNFNELLEKYVKKMAVRGRG